MSVLTFLYPFDKPQNLEAVNAHIEIAPVTPPPWGVLTLSEICEAAETMPEFFLRIAHPT